MDSLQPFVAWLGDSAAGHWLGQSETRVAALFVVHLVGLTLLLGGTAVVCFRLLGIGFRSGPAAVVTRDVAPWWMAGLTLTLVSGSLIFIGGAESYFEGRWFRRKMVLLAVALIFQVTWFRIVAYASDGRFSAWQTRLTAALALLLWFGVAIAGRAIAFF